MSAPVLYETKQPHTVQAMLYNAWDGTTDLKDWVTGLLSTSFEEETISLNDNGNGAFEIYIGEDFLLRIESGQYVYLDEDGIHAASKGAFEMYYRQAPPA